MIKYIKDIHSFEVNTRNIFECNENISIFHERKARVKICEVQVKIWMCLLHQMNIFMIFTPKSKFSFYSIIFHDKLFLMSQLRSQNKM